MNRYCIGLIAVLCAIGPAHAGSPVVLELFTSQSCSSCPPADQLLQALAKDPDVLALSFHVTYWDQEGWKDPFSLPASTARQNDYASSLHQVNVYTPELVVDGVKGVVGSQRDAVMSAVSAARMKQKPVAVAITASADAHHLTISFTGQKSGGAPADVWLVTYNPKAVTAVQGGENSGLSLSSINNVTSVARIAQIAGATPTPMTIPLSAKSDDSYAVLVQAPGGALLGAAAYTPPPL